MRSAEYIIAPPTGNSRIDLKELWRYRDLFVVLAWRDIAVRYRQTLLGVLWVFLQPLLTMAVFTILFNRVAGIQSGSSAPYPVFVLVGLLFWQYSAGAINSVSNSIIGNINLVKKVYFPRVIVPAAAATAGLIDLLVASIVLIGLMLYYRLPLPSALGVVVLPLLILIAFLFALGLGLFLASVNVRYRDVRYALPFFVQLLMYVTPVIYPVKLLDSQPELRSMVLLFNPMSGIITTARAGLLGTEPINFTMMLIALVAALTYFVLGLYWFGRTESDIVDVA